MLKFLALLLIFSETLMAEQVVIRYIDGPAQTSIIDSKSADINGDQWQDIISISVDDGTVRAYLNQGNNTYTEQWIAEGIFGAFRLVPVDHNNDRLTDWLIPELETGSIILLLNTEKGFQKQTLVDQVSLAADVHSHDFNNDGFQDLIVASFDLDTVFFFRGNQQGGFDRQRLTDQVIQPRDIEIGDFNLDGLMDFLVVSSGDGSVRFFQNTADDFNEVLITDQLTGPLDTAVCDLNNDWVPDFVVTATGDNQILGFINRSGQRFDQSVIDADFARPVALTCGNIDNDLNNELIVLDGQSNIIYSLETTGEDKTMIADQRDGYVRFDLYQSDDNSPVQLLTQSFFEYRNLLYNVGALNQEQVVWEGFPEGANADLMADMNQDGTNDYLVAAFRKDTVYWYDGITGQKHVVGTEVDGANDLTVVDLDLDGLPDVLSAASFGNRFIWHRNKGNNQFENITIDDQASFANAIDHGDINADGVPDVVATAGSDDAVYWYERQGTGFIKHLIDDESDGPTDVHVVDIQNDGLPDVVVAYSFSAEVVAYINSPNQSFSKVRLINGVDRANSIQVGEFTANELTDVLVSSSTLESIWLIQQTSLGVFQSSLLLNSLSSPKWFKAYFDQAVIYVNETFDIFERVQQYSLTTIQKGVEVSTFANDNPMQIGSYFNQSALFVILGSDEIFKNSFEDTPNNSH